MREQDKAELGEESPRYLVPAQRVEHEAVLSKSRFMTTLDRAASAAAAGEFVAARRVEFPDATHHCWAFVAGPPGDSAVVGLSDDGEPHGSAGRPMLNALLHSQVGEVVAVCTRYYGGTKLGTGGLARAYGGGVVAALELLSTEWKEDWLEQRVRLPFSDQDAVERLTKELGVKVLERSFSEQVQLLVSVPARRNQRWLEQLRHKTRARATVEPEDP